MRQGQDSADLRDTRWLLVILWLSFIFWMSTGMFSAQHTFLVVRLFKGFFFPHLAYGHVMPVHALVRKTAHVTEYFVLGLLLFRALGVGSARPCQWRWSVLALLGVLLCALSDELHQWFVPSRTASMVDVGIDTAGGILAQIASTLWYHYPYGRDGNPGGEGEEKGVTSWE